MVCLLAGTDVIHLNLQMDAANSGASPFKPVVKGFTFLTLQFCLVSERLALKNL